ncbi:DUF4232 domain-containing protein [Streptomyces hoynatensis]|uniref:DUF4232 domain-containing protein n=1 Tax=Streptomyces hoynatensis TaxID=1141874 RepID=A0A3A9ZBR2_9ACTN|nr:DUF4232 domain-containing protein [Streptomyces hoynatensis]RKN44816.1 DUF4232 domain-containing protein [Streptomyces hoynatensis]
MSSYRRRSAALTSLTVLAVLFAGGCSDSGDSDSGSDSSAQDQDSGGQSADGDAGDSSDAGDADDGDSGSDDANDEDSDTGNAAAQGEIPWCTAEALSPSLNPLDSGAGQRYAALVLTNVSDGSCRTQGWPGLMLLDADDNPIQTETIRDRSEESHQITVAPGDSVWSRLHWTVVAGDQDAPDGTCGTEPASLAVIAPDEQDFSSAEWDFGQVCGGGTIDAVALVEGSGPEE